MPAVMLLMLVGVAASVVVAAYEPADSGDSAPAYDNSGAAADDVYAAAELAETEGHRGYKHRHGHHHHTGRKHHEDPEYDNPFGNEYTEEPPYHRHVMSTRCPSMTMVTMVITTSTAPHQVGCTRAVGACGSTDPPLAMCVFYRQLLSTS